MLALCLAIQSCKTETHEGSTIVTGTETNWLRSCSGDSECGDLTCECGICTQRCDQDACQLTGAVCSPNGSAAVAALCQQGAAASSLCLPACDATCAVGQVCVAGACIPTLDASSPGDTSNPIDSTIASTNEPNSNVQPNTSSFATTSDADATVEDSGLNGSVDASVTTTTAPTSSVDAYTLLDAGAPTDAGAGCPLDTRPLTDGCCYLDTDCADGQLCYQAACSGDVMAPGRCANPPSAPNCYSDRDCSTGEACQDGHLASCGTLGPDTLGTCIADCDYDSCHPERCDQVGEPCCDPFPGDGPNYCNAALECMGNSCAERAETTTPEAQAQQACEETGGTWDYESCGNYVCGEAPNCDAIIPGCNCGSGQSFDTLGCTEDPNCPQ